MCFQGTRGRVLWTQGHRRRQQTSDSKYASDTWSTKTSKHQVEIINYCYKFLPRLSTILVPLHKLFAKNGQWNWWGEQDQAFYKSKELLTSTLLGTLLWQYQYHACDASPYMGFWCVLFYIIFYTSWEVDEEKLILYTSRALTEIEIEKKTNYANW